MKNLFLEILLIVCLYNCTGLKIIENLPGGYVLLKDNESFGLSIAWPLEDGNYVDLIPNNVFEVGYNDRFIIAK